MKKIIDTSVVSPEKIREIVLSTSSNLSLIDLVKKF